ncbi:MAG TPA: DUF4384 domain-containing protein [Blastocatellia bacterium]
MRARNLMIVLCIAAAAFAAAPGFGQSARSRAIEARYDSGAVDGMRVTVLKSEAGRFVPVDAGRQFKKGDEIKIAFESNFEGYVYIVNVSPTGKKKVLFPNSQTGNNAIIPRQQYELPSGGVMFFDNETGVEVLQVMMSREPIALYEQAVRDSGGALGESSASVAAEFSSVGKTGVVVSDLATPEPGLRSRGLELAPGSDKTDKSTTLIANPDKTTKMVKLGKGELAMFEIRLKHV